MDSLRLLSKNKIHTLNDLLKWMMENIEYGWVDKNGKVYLGNDAFANPLRFYNDYRLQSPTQFIKSKIGVCWDQVVFQQECFDLMKLSSTHYYLELDNSNRSTHTFSIVNVKGDKLLWFEHAYQSHKGIHPVNKTLKTTFNEIIEYVRGEEDTPMDNGGSIYELPTTVLSGLSCQQFMDTSKQGKLVYNFKSK